jgi:hypothetical protein
MHAEADALRMCRSVWVCRSVCLSTGHSRVGPQACDYVARCAVCLSVRRGFAGSLPDRAKRTMNWAWYSSICSCRQASKQPRTHSSYTRSNEPYSKAAVQNQPNVTHRVAIQRPTVLVRSAVNNDTARSVARSQQAHTRGEVTGPLFHSHHTTNNTNSAAATGTRTCVGLVIG